MSQKIEEMFAFVIQDEQGNESVPAFLGNKLWYPLVAADAARVNSLRKMAQRMARDSGQKITLCRFSVREELEVIEPVAGQGGAGKCC